jgi:hypothetical protein
MVQMDELGNVNINTRGIIPSSNLNLNILQVPLLYAPATARRFTMNLMPTNSLTEDWVSPALIMAIPVMVQIGTDGLLRFISVDQVTSIRNNFNATANSLNFIIEASYNVRV